MRVDYFSFSYFLMLIVAFLFALLNYFILKNRSPKFQKYYIFFLLLSAFSLHFLKQLFEPYRSNLPAGFRHSTFENICAVSVLIFPWIFISKSKRWKDYMYYIGILSGVGAMLIPTEALGKELLSFDILRFYYVHIVIFTAPMLMVKFGFHKLDYRRVFQLPLSFIIILVVILVNEVVLIAAGFVQTDMATFLNQTDRNSSFIFGPTKYFDNFIGLVMVFVPSLFKKPLIGATDQVLYWPILWMVIPCYIYLPLCGLLLSLPYEGERIKTDLSNFYTKTKQKIMKKRG